MSENLVELVRRHHAEQAPTALAVLKEAMDARGEITDADRRLAAARSGLPEATVHGVSTFYDDLLAPRGRRHVRVCTGTACFAATGDAHVEQLRAGLGLGLGERTANGSCSLAETVCLGFCHSSPAVRDGDVIDAGPGVVERVLAGATQAAAEPAPVSVLGEPVLTRPGDWSGLARALEGSPEELLEAVKDATVRGRGGAGFPAGQKWAFARAAAGEEKFIVANGDEGDPGSYIDKLLMERSPALVLEGMALAGYAVGAAHGFALVRSEYPRSKPALEQAAARARAEGWLGEDVRGSGFSFDVTIVEGAGSYVVGEETALLACIEGLRGTVSARPPFPAQRGLFDLPTVVNNVETLANMGFVARHGADAYRALSARRDARLEARLLQRALRAAGRLRGALRHPAARAVRGAGRRPARRPHDQGAADRRPARRDPARLQARHPVRLRRARGRGLHGRPWRDRRLRRRDGHACGRAPPVALRRVGELRQVLSVSDRAAARARAVRRRRARGARAAGAAAGDIGAGQPLRPRRRDAGADPQPARALAAGAGTRMSLRVTIDGHELEVAEGATLLDAARAAGSWVPTLCFDERQAPFGACRVCLVGVEGSKVPLPACTTPCRDGMAVDHGRPDRAPRRDRRRRARALRAARAAARRTPSWPTIARALDVGEPRWPGATHAVAHEDDHPYLAFRHELCISCGRCVRACDEVQGTFALTAVGRGFGANVAAGLDEGFRDSACVSCGACADTCPTEAIAEVSLLDLMEASA